MGSLVMASALVLFGAGAVGCGGEREAKDASSAGGVERVPYVDETVAAFKKKDPSIARFFEVSAGYVVLPTVGEGGLVVGGAHGRGEAFEGGVYVGRVTVTEVSLGAQVGGRSFSEVVFFETPTDFHRLKQGTFKFGAEVSAIAANAGVAKNARFNNGVATFVIPKAGLMAAAAVGGQQLDFTPRE